MVEVVRVYIPGLPGDINPEALARAVAAIEEARGAAVAEVTDLHVTAIYKAREIIVAEMQRLYADLPSLIIYADDPPVTPALE